VKSAHEVPAPAATADEEVGAPSGLARVAVRGVSISAAGYAVTQAVSFATYLVLARLLEPRDLGVFAAATVVIGWGLIVSESGMLAALIQRRNRLEEAFNTAFVASIVMGLALTAAGVAVAPLIGLFFHSFEIGIMAAAMAGSMALKASLIVPSARLQRSFSFTRRTVLDPLGTAMFAAGSITGALAGLGAWALVIGTYAQIAVDVIAAWSFVRWRPRPRLATMAMWRELARFGRPVFSANLVADVTIRVPVVAVGRVLGAATLGQLSYAIRVGTQPVQAIIEVGAYALLPAYARIAANAARFRAGLLRSLRWLCAIAFPFGLLLVPLGTPAIVLVFGARWREAGYGVMALGVYCAAMSVCALATEVFKAAGRPKVLPRMRAVSLALMIVCVGGLVPFGLIPVTIGMAASAVGVALYAVHGIKTVLDIPYSELAAEIWPAALAATAMAGILFVTEHMFLHSDHRSLPVGISLLAAQALLGLLIYLPCLAALSAACRRELSGVLRLTRFRRLAQAAQEGR
jgi:PST family polysaccharide transporter